MSDLTPPATHLRIHWEAHGGRGNGSWQPMEKKESLDAWVKELQRAHAQASFSIEYGRPSEKDLQYRPYPR